MLFDTNISRRSTAGARTTELSARQAVVRVAEGMCAGVAKAEEAKRTTAARTDRHQTSSFTTNAINPIPGR